MSRILIFIAGFASGFYLCKFSSADQIVFAILIVIFLIVLILGYLLHLGFSDFQEFEQSQEVE